MADLSQGEPSLKIDPDPEPDPETKTEINIRLTKQFRSRLQTFTCITFLILLICSIIYAFTLITLWVEWPEMNMMTNMYPAFCGFVCSNVLNVIASIAGISTFSKNEGQRLDSQHSTAVCCLLLGSMVYNLVFPTSGLMPLEIDSRTRILKVPVMDCNKPKHVLHHVTNTPVAECAHAEDAKLCLYLMYPLMLIELTALLSYGYLKIHRHKDLTRSDDSTLNSINEDDDTLTSQIIRVDALGTCTTGDVSTLIPQSSKIVKRRLSDRERDHFYWDNVPVIKSQSAPVRVTSHKSIL